MRDVVGTCVAAFESATANGVGEHGQQRQPVSRARSMQELDLMDDLACTDRDVRGLWRQVGGGTR